MQITEKPVPRRRPCQKRHLVDVIRDQGDECWKPHTKEGISSSTDTGFYVNKTGITQCPHCQSSFCQPLKISFQSLFLRFENISHVMISFSNPGWRHFAMTRMRTYLIFGDRPNLLISCCIPAIPRFILQSDVKDTEMGKTLGNRAIWTSDCRIQGVSKVVRPCKRRCNSLTFGGVSQRGYSNETFQWAGRRSHGTSHLSYLSQWAAFIWVTKGMQITENPVPRRRLKKDNWLMSSVIRGMNVENRIQKKAYPHQPTLVSMSTKQESLNVLTAKVRSVSPWGSRFNLSS